MTQHTLSTSTTSSFTSYYLKINIKDFVILTNLITLDRSVSCRNVRPGVKAHKDFKYHTGRAPIPHQHLFKHPPFRMSQDLSKFTQGELVNIPQVCTWGPTGPVELTCIQQFHCKSIEAADELLPLLQNIKAINDPGMLVFRICRWEKVIIIFEV